MLSALDQFIPYDENYWDYGQVYDGLLASVPTTKQIGYRARFIVINGKITLIPEPEFHALAMMLMIMRGWNKYPTFTFNYVDINIMEQIIREHIGDTWSSHWSPSASIRKLAERGVLTFKRESVAGRKNTFNYVVTFNGQISISDHGMLCIGENK